MKLRNKVLLSISLVWAIFLIITFVASHFFLLHGFLALEDERANRDLNRVYQALEQNSSTLYAYTADWSNWTDAYNFMKGKNPYFVSNNFKMPSFINSNINLITYWNQEGKQVAGKAINTNTQKYTRYPKGLDKYIYPNSPLVKIHKNLRGYILIDDGIMAIASSTITDGDKIQPPLGVAIFGRLLSPHILKKINQSTQVNTTLFLSKQIERSPKLTKAFKSASTNPAKFIINSDDDKNKLYGYIVIKDINGQPIGMLQTTTSRLIYLSGLKIINYYLASFIALGILFSLLMLWLLRVLIIQRLESLNHHVEKISKHNTLSQRIDEKGNDEIVSLAHQINSMMSMIEISQTKLEHRVKERTQELQNMNIQLQQEIAERKSIEKELTINKEHLMHLAHYDNLTGLPNRFFFNELLTKILHQINRKKGKLAILYINLDHFKKINDSLGHSIGDLVLKEIANRFLKIIRSSDILARLSGDEFVILLNDIDDPKFASSIAEKILKICLQPLKINGYEFILTTSVGISTYPEDGASLEDLLKNADMAMYKAKKVGGGIFNYYTKAMDVEAHERIKLESALRNAIHRNEFLLHYQPKVQLSDNTIISVEALIRWENPILGLVSPEKFIPLAEETGLILQIGEWVLREACRINKSWQDQGYEPITIAVNLSARQFHHPDISRIIATILAETKLEPKYLELEMTETVIMDNIDMIVETLHAIRKMGVKISIDDFGTGYTSISHLKQFPINVIKIDKSFIKELPNSHNDASITTAIIALAHTLNIKVVAEGVETDKQVQFLIDHDCDIAQGYYFSPPVTEENIVLQFKTKVKTTTA